MSSSNNDSGGGGRGDAGRNDELEGMHVSFLVLVLLLFSFRGASMVNIFAFL